MTLNLKHVKIIWKINYQNNEMIDVYSFSFRELLEYVQLI